MNEFKKQMPNIQLGDYDSKIQGFKVRFTHYAFERTIKIGDSLEEFIKNVTHAFLDHLYNKKRHLKSEITVIDMVIEKTKELHQNSITDKISKT